MTICIRLALYNENENGDPVEFSQEELEDIRDFIARKQDVYGFAIASVDIVEEQKYPAAYADKQSLG